MGTSRISSHFFQPKTAFACGLSSTEFLTITTLAGVGGTFMFGSIKPRVDKSLSCDNTRLGCIDARSDAIPSNASMPLHNMHMTSPMTVDSAMMTVRRLQTRDVTRDVSALGEIS